MSHPACRLDAMSGYRFPAGVTLSGKCGRAAGAATTRFRIPTGAQLTSAGSVAGAEVPLSVARGAGAVTVLPVGHRRREPCPILIAARGRCRGGARPDGPRPDDPRAPARGQPRGAGQGLAGQSRGGTRRDRRGGRPHTRAVRSAPLDLPERGRVAVRVITRTAMEMTSVTELTSDRRGGR